MTNATTSRGPWVQTYTGRRFYILDPQPEDVSLFDVAHALSNLCRYGGHSSRFYSVAEHSVLTSLIVPRQHALQALLHDASEAYLVDVPRPLKVLLPNYQSIEREVEDVIMDKFGLPRELHPEVKLADNRVLLVEREALMPEAPPDWWPGVDGLERPDVEVRAWGPEAAEVAFLRRLNELTR